MRAGTGAELIRIWSFIKNEWRLMPCKPDQERRQGGEETREREKERREGEGREERRKERRERREGGREEERQS